MKQRVTLSVVDSITLQLAKVDDAGQKVKLLLVELGKMETINLKVQLAAEEKNKLIKTMESKLAVKDEEIAGLAYNYQRVKRRLDVLQEESKDQVLYNDQNQGMLGGIAMGFGFLKGNKQPGGDKGELELLKTKFADVIAQNGTVLHYPKMIIVKR